MGTNKGIEVLTDAHSYLLEVVAEVPEAAWGAPTPCTEWTARQVLNHARVDQQAYGLALTGGRPDSDPFRPADALTGRPEAELERVLRQVADAYGGLGADGEAVPTPLGPLPSPIAAAAAAMDAAVHAWDIAVATGVDRPLSADLAGAIRPAADRLVDHLRESYRVFAPARPAGPGADPAAELLAFLGRDPQWTPAAP
ncbi:TIGR03086 family metal-binding protein [Streptomyces sp. MS06]|uniref:TIGR03086 family metal-binding protein n=1 Tax=Streptomyces sp. MS06 TaxID=3385974 RepID=UPI0039A22D50